MSADTPHGEAQLLRKIGEIQAQIARGELPAAAQALNAVQKLAPGDARVLATGSMLAERSGNLKGALMLAQKAVDAAPIWPVAVLALARLQAQAGQFTQAMVSATKAVDLASSDAYVLATAVHVAQQSEDVAQALQWLRMLDRNKPGQRWVQQHIANSHRYMGEYQDAMAEYADLMRSDPHDEGVVLGHAQCAVALGKLDIAKDDCEILRKMDPDNEVYRFWEDVAHGRTPATQPRAMVQQLADDRPELYDMHMMHTLKYSVAQDVALRIKKLYPTLEINVLDLGCGTGLLGVFLGRVQGALVGVDVSEASLAMAARHDVYDSFHSVNVLDALRETPGNLYNVITACDLFVYVGDLTSVIPNALRILKPGGHFLFSCEEADEDEPNLVLRNTVRYAHKRSDVKAQLKRAGFVDIKIADSVLRLENKLPERGFIVSARKSIAKA